MTRKKQYRDLFTNKKVKNPISRKDRRAYRKLALSNPFESGTKLKVNNRKNPAGSLNPQRKYKKKPNFKF